MYYSKQIMTASSVTGRSICPERFRIASPRVSIDRGASPPQEFLLTEAQPRSIETLGEAILNLKVYYIIYYNYYLLRKLN